MADYHPIKSASEKQAKEYGVEVGSKITAHTQLAKKFNVEVGDWTQFAIMAGAVQGEYGGSTNSDTVNSHHLKNMDYATGGRLKEFTDAVGAFPRWETGKAECPLTKDDINAIVKHVNDNFDGETPIAIKVGNLGDLFKNVGITHGDFLKMKEKAEAEMQKHIDGLKAAPGHVQDFANKSADDHLKGIQGGLKGLGIG